MQHINKNEIVTYNGRSYDSSYLVENVLPKLSLQNELQYATFFNIPNTLDTIVFYYYANKKLNDIQVKTSYELLIELFNIEISEFFYCSGQLQVDKSYYSQQQAIKDYIGAKVYAADTEENYRKNDDRYAYSVGVLKENGKCLFARTIAGDLKISPLKGVIMPMLVPNDLYRFYYRDNVVVFAERLSLSEEDLMKIIDGHEYKLVPFDKAPREDIETLQEGFHSIGERIIPTVLNYPYPDFLKMAQKMRTWDCDEPIVGALVFFLYYDNKIVGALDFRYALSEKLRYYGGHCGGAIIPMYRNQGFASIFFLFSDTIARCLGYQKIRITCRHTNEPVQRILKKTNSKLIRSYKRTEEIVEDVYDILL